MIDDGGMMIRVPVHGKEEQVFVKLERTDIDALADLIANEYSDASFGMPRYFTKGRAVSVMRKLILGIEEALER